MTICVVFVVNNNMTDAVEKKKKLVLNAKHSFDTLTKRLLILNIIIKMTL